MAQAEKPLDIQFIDVEGGQANSDRLAVGRVPAGGHRISRFRQQRRRRAVPPLSSRGISRGSTIQSSRTTRRDARLAARRRWPRACRLRTFVDHGPTMEQGDRPAALFNEYLQTRAKGRHVLARRTGGGPRRALRSSAAGDLITKAAGRRRAQRALPRLKPAAPDPSENARRWRGFFLRQLAPARPRRYSAWNKEHDLGCQNNLLGAVDVYLTTHHGLDQSGPAESSCTRCSRACARDEQRSQASGCHAWRIIRDSAGARRPVAAPLRGGRRRRPQRAGERFIANLDDTTARGSRIAPAARRPVRWLETNARNGQSKTSSTTPRARGAAVTQPVKN